MMCSRLLLPSAALLALTPIAASATEAATAATHEAVDILRFAGCHNVLELGEMLGGFMAQRVFAGDGRSHVVGQTDGLLIAEAWAAGTSLVGRTLRELRLSDAASLLAMLSTEEVSRFISPPPTTVEGFERFIAWTHRERAAGNYICFAVVPQNMDTAVGIFQALVVEALLTFFLAQAVLFGAVEGLAGKRAGFVIGLTLFFCILLGGPLTGASLNPARTLGPAIFTGNLDTFWIYLVGPLAGAALAAGLYRFLRK